jgi:type IX secretion system substrate protein
MQPNPTTDVIFVNYELNANTNIKLSVIDLTGRKVIDILNATESKGVHTHQINLNKVSSGIYLLNFVTDNGSFNAKFVKQ